MKKLIAFDLDDTLAITKSPIDDRMAEALPRLLDHFDVCVISGANLNQFMKQVVNCLNATPQQLRGLHLMPTCGTRYYRYKESEQSWDQVYAEDLSRAQKDDAIAALKQAAKQLGYWPAKPYGEIIEDRDSQITFSALGQEAPADAKYAWDPDGSKKHAIRDVVAPLLSDVEVRVGGTTSIDVTMIGIDKAYGMKKLMEILNISREDILFFGDKLESGGNDYPVKAMGIDCLEVSRWQDTVLALEAILHVV